MDFKYCKLEIFIPETHISQLQKALQSVVDETIQAIKEIHPYEEPVINALPIYRTSF